MKTKLFGLVMLLAVSLGLQAEDHVMAATKKQPQRQVASELVLSLKEAQDYAVAQNRSLRNAELAVQQAYAQRWQTIASMLPSVDASWTYTNMFGYEMTFGSSQSTPDLTAAEAASMAKFAMDYPGVAKLAGGMMGGGGGTTIKMPNNSALGISASIGLNGQAVVGAVMNGIALKMKQIALEQSEDELRSSVRTSYAALLVLDGIVTLLDSSYTNLQQLEEMMQRSVDVGAAEQTVADQIRVRANTLKDNIASTKRNIHLSENSLKVLLDVPVDTKVKLTTELEQLLSADEVVALLGHDFIKENNLNYRTLEQNVRLAQAGVHSAAWAYGPTVGLSYQYSKQHYYGDGGMRMTPPNLFALSVQMPLWSSGKRAAAVTEKKIALESARNTLAETSDNLAIQHQQLRYTLQNAYESYLTQKENLEVTERVFRSTSNKFHYGAASNLELVNASNDVISAQSSYVNAVLTLVNAQASLETFLNL